MPKVPGIDLSESLQFPNLLSLLRIVIIPFIGYYLSKANFQSTMTCVALLVVAGITDVLDGYLARRMKQVSRLGMVLDPLADKILAAALVVMLVFFRDLSLWLALVIVGRDLLILVAGILLLKGKNVVVPSNLTGKYAFVAIAFLIGSYIIRFGFGATLMTYVAIALIVASTIIYARGFIQLKKGCHPDCLQIGISTRLHGVL